MTCRLGCRWPLPLVHRDGGVRLQLPVSNRSIWEPGVWEPGVGDITRVGDDNAGFDRSLHTSQQRGAGPQNADTYIAVETLQPLHFHSFPSRLLVISPPGLYNSLSRTGPSQRHTVQVPQYSASHMHFCPGETEPPAETPRISVAGRARMYVRKSIVRLKPYCALCALCAQKKLAECRLLYQMRGLRIQNPFHLSVGYGHPGERRIRMQEPLLHHFLTCGACISMLGTSKVRAYLEPLDPGSRGSGLGIQGRESYSQLSSP